MFLTKWCTIIAVKMKKILYPGRIKEAHTKKIQDHGKKLVVSNGHKRIGSVVKKAFA